MLLYTLGTSHGAAEKGRSRSGHLLTLGNSNYLFDCGGAVEEKMTDLGLSFKSVRAVFITHMHEDHVGTLSSIYKHFMHYNRSDDCTVMHLPEQNGIDAFKSWVSAMHMHTDKVSFRLSESGVVYTDENITVTAIRTEHVEDGRYESYAYMIEGEGKRILYTGDLNRDFHDYPAIVFEKDFDLILCELVHFSAERNLDTIIKSRTKHLVFTHMSPRNIPYVESVRDRFPFPVSIANDNDCFEI